MITVARAPARVNLIGEHTDYNDGFVFPVALSLETQAAASPREDRLVAVRSNSFDASITFDLDHLSGGHKGHWSDATRGMLIELQRAGYTLRGCDLVIDGTIPIGAGLSSSASVEIAVGLVLLSLAGDTIDRVELAKIAQRAEHEHGGTRCGIMDQCICALAQEGSAMLLDTRALTYRNVALPRGAEFIVVNSMVSHELAAGAHGERRRQCEEAALLLRRQFPHLQTLRDALPEELEALHDSNADDVLYRRARHVVTENARTLDAASALEAGDLQMCGNAMSASHKSLRDDFEVSCKELDMLVELAQQFDGVYGSRMTGGGFGGSTVHLVAAEASDDFCRGIARRYAEVTESIRRYIEVSAAEARRCKHEAATAPAT